MKEAVTMKSWANLKGSMDKISDQVRQILFVRNDLSMMQDDLTTQERLWKEAEVQMSKENVELKAKMEALKREVHSQATLQSQVRQLQASLAQARAEDAAAKKQLATDEARAAMETARLRAHEQALFADFAKLNDTIIKEEQAANERKSQVKADGTVLKRKVDELQDLLTRAQAELTLGKQQDAAKTLDMQHQIEQMKGGLARMKGEVVPRGQLDAETERLRAQLQQETLTILKVQQDGAQMQAACEAEKTRREEVSRAEQVKADDRVQQKNQYCDAVNGQNGVLSQMVAACQLKAAR